MEAVRGVWITNVDSHVLDSQDNINEAIELLANTGFNVVFPVVWNKGFTLYRSEAMQQNFGNDFAIDPKYGNRDPLQELIDAAKPKGIKVIPWFEFGFAYSHVSINDQPKQLFAKKLKERNWVAVDRNKDQLVDNGFEWMNALNPDVQDFMLSLVLEVARNYDVDGIQGDDRFPAFPVEGFDEVAANNFAVKFGRKPRDPQEDPPDRKWMQFRANILTDFLARLREKLKAVGEEKGKKLILSMAPHPPAFGFNKYLQDTKAWIERGLLDMIHPQLYRDTVEDYKNLMKTEKVIEQFTPKNLPLLAPGIKMNLEGERPFLIKSNSLWEVIAHNRRLGVRGEVFFFFEGLRHNNNNLAKVLQEKGYSEFVRLFKGLEGSDVEEIQQLLKNISQKQNKKEFDPGDIDGEFGQRSHNAVLAFQKANDLDDDGIVGRATLKKLREQQLSEDT